MANQWTRTRALVGFLALCISAFGPGARSDVSATSAMLSLELGHQQAAPVHLENPQLRLPGPEGGYRLVPLTMERVPTTYRAKLLRNGKTVERQGFLPFLVEMRSTDPGAPYSWAYASLHDMGSFEVFNKQDGANYLTWAEGPYLRFAEVSSQRTRRAAVDEALILNRTSGIVGFSLTRFIPIVETGRNALRCQVRVFSLDKDASGTWTIKLSGITSDSVYTIVGDGKTWHLEGKTPLPVSK